MFNSYHDIPPDWRASTMQPLASWEMNSRGTGHLAARAIQASMKPHLLNKPTTKCCEHQGTRVCPISTWCYIDSNRCATPQRMAVHELGWETLWINMGTAELPSRKALAMVASSMCMRIVHQTYIIVCVRALHIYTNTHIYIYTSMYIILYIYMYKHVYM